MRMGNKTGPKPGFTRKQVVDAALELGIADFTLGQVAQRLGVGPSALYRTISSRDDLLQGCLNRISARADFSGLEKGTWQDTVRAYAQKMWEFTDEYPGLARTLMTVPWAHQAFSPHIHTCIQGITDTGLDRPFAVFAVKFVGDTVVSTHMMIETVRQPVTPPAFPSTVVQGNLATAPTTTRTTRCETPTGATLAPADSLTGLDIARHRYQNPAIRDVLPEEFAPSPIWAGRGWLETKIEVVIAGIEALLQDGRGFVLGAFPKLSSREE